MKQFHVVLSGIAILVAGLGASTVWWRVSLDSGQVVAFSGTESSAALWSLGAVASTSFGLQFTLRGLARRIIASVQAFFGGFFAVLTLLVAADPLSTAASAIAEVTGVSGSNALAMVSSIELTGWHFSAVIAGGLMALGGILGTLAGDRLVSSDRFKRRSSSGSVEDSVSAWDSLSDGDDPTRR